MALACRITKGAAFVGMLGGGNSTGNKRAFIGLDASGFLTVGWGTSVTETSPVDRSGADAVIVVTGDGVSREVYLNGAVLTFAAMSGGPDGTGGALALGAYNNNGTPQNWAGGNLYAALALNRRVTPSEIAGITSILRSTYQ